MKASSTKTPVYIRNTSDDLPSKVPSCILDCLAFVKYFYKLHMYMYVG